MTREELKEQIDELMRQYDEGEIDGATYAQCTADDGVDLIRQKQN